MGRHQESIEGKGISSFTISQNGNAIFKKNDKKKKIIITAFTIVALCFAAIVIHYSYIMKAAYTVCQTKSCLQSTVSLITCMNETVEPCEDFYEFACGMFEKNYASFSNENENSWTTMISLKVNYIVKKFLEQKDEMNEPQSVHKIRKFYKTCLKCKEDHFLNNFDSLRNAWKKIGLDENYLNDSIPLKIETILARAKVNLNMDILFDVSTDYDPRNSSSHLLLIISPYEESNKFKKRQSMITNNEESLPKFKQYFKELIDTLLDQNQTYHKNIIYEDLTNSTKELADFYEEFSMIAKNASITTISSIPQIFTIEKLQNMTDSLGDRLMFNWTLYMRELFLDVDTKVYEQLSSENVNNFEILISNVDFINQLFTLLSNTPTNIMRMAMLTLGVSKLESEFPPTNNLETEYCFLKTVDNFGMVTGYSLINTLDNSSKSALIEMKDNIIWALRKMINEVDWMDDKTKYSNLRKLDNTKTFFGYPNNYSSTIDNLYENLNFTDNHIENLVRLSQFIVKTQWKQLTENQDIKNIDWSTDVPPSDVNAYDIYSLNTFFIPTAFLQYPLYYNGLQSLNYGATGSTIGHELSHNYDGTGRQYNELGNVAEWWTKKSVDEYTTRAECLVRYYDNVKVTRYNKTFPVNGRATLDENIADIMGLKEAYLAYQRYVDKHGPEPKLPSMEKYTQEQLFFLGYANQYCHYDMNEPSKDSHSSNVVRVKVVLSLSQEFAKTWSCPLGSPMNPKKDKKCQIW